MIFRDPYVFVLDHKRTEERECKARSPDGPWTAELSFSQGQRVDVNAEGETKLHQERLKKSTKKGICRSMTFPSYTLFLII